jgi:predicted hydrocarbon binding protein
MAEMSSEAHVTDSEDGLEAGLEGEPRGEVGYFFANKMGRIFYLALEEVAAGEALSGILNAARMQHRLDGYPPNNFDAEFSFDEVGKIQQTLEELYGPSSARALARDVGRACFRIGAQDLNPVLGLTDPALRILPLRMRFRIGLEVLAQLFDRFSDHIVRLEEDERAFGWVVERCAVCWGRQTDSPCCDLMVGLLEEGVYWISGGERFHVEEISCIAAGDATCTVLIDKQPLGRQPSMEEEV